MSYKEYVTAFDTEKAAWDAVFQRLPIWKRVRGKRTMTVEFYERRWWIIIIEK